MSHIQHVTIGPLCFTARCHKRRLVEFVLLARQVDSICFLCFSCMYTVSGSRVDPTINGYNLTKTYPFLSEVLDVQTLQQTNKNQRIYTQQCQFY